jgi:hypothetical protein
VVVKKWQLKKILRTNNGLLMKIDENKWMIYIYVNDTVSGEPLVSINVELV